MTSFALPLIFGSGLAWAGFDALRKFMASRAATLPLTAALLAAQLPLFAAWVGLEAARPAVASGYWAPAALTIALNVAASLMLLRALFAGGTKGPLLMVGVAALWAITGPIDKIALRYTSTAIHATFQASGVTLALLAATAVRHQLPELSSLAARPARLLTAVAFAAVALGMQLLAIQLTLVSLVETIKRTIGTLGSMLNGRVFFGEPLTPIKLLAALVMSGGVTLILM